jgi:hypothetical protein
MRCAAIIVFLILALAFAGALMADSGFYKLGKHADPAIGVVHDPDLPRGNCSQCHLLHDGDTPYDFALFAPADNSTCLSGGCHEYEYQWPPGNYYWPYPGNTPGWYNSAHGSSTGLYPAAGGREVRLCVQCHNPHAAGDSIVGVYPSATAALEEHGCYSYGAVTGQGCHGMNDGNRPVNADNIYSQMLKSSRHDVTVTSKAHSSDWRSAPPYGRESRNINSGSFSGANWHVECVDCHNPHEAVPGNHRIGSNEIGATLLGGWGVEPINGGPGVTPTTYNVVEFNSIAGSREYQLCFKCHSYYAFGNTLPTGFTDNAREFNPANRSFHPVEDTIPTNSYTVPTAANGFTPTMTPEWDNGMRNTMTCSDCHSSETSTDPRGPHGSNNAYILSGSPAATGIDLCLNCHLATVYNPAIDPDAAETGSRFDRQTTGDDGASHFKHVTDERIGCRQCHGARQTAPPASPEQRSPYPIDLGSLHGSDTFPGLLNGVNINAYAPGSCTPTCHPQETYNAGPE